MDTSITGREARNTSRGRVPLPKESKGNSQDAWVPVAAMLLIHNLAPADLNDENHLRRRVLVLFRV